MATTKYCPRCKENVTCKEKPGNLLLRFMLLARAIIFLLCPNCGTELGSIVLNN